MMAAAAIMHRIIAAASGGSEANPDGDEVWCASVDRGQSGANAE